MTQALLDGSTRLHFIVGDPIAQVKSPGGMSQAFAAQGRNALCVPAHVAPPQLAAWLAGVSLAQNVDGIIVTVPHKFACFELCATASERARFLGAVNTLRRNPDGSWHGDMFDGLGYVQALRAKDCDPANKRALLVGPEVRARPLPTRWCAQACRNWPSTTPIPSAEIPSSCAWPAWARPTSRWAARSRRALTSPSTPVLWACSRKTPARWTLAASPPPCSWVA
jgi:hypothetical protein